MWCKYLQFWGPVGSVGSRSGLYGDAWVLCGVLAGEVCNSGAPYIIFGAPMLLCWPRCVCVCFGGGGPNAVIAVGFLLSLTGFQTMYACNVQYDHVVFWTNSASAVVSVMPCGTLWPQGWATHATGVVPCHCAGVLRLTPALAAVLVSVGSGLPAAVSMWL